MEESKIESMPRTMQFKLFDLVHPLMYFWNNCPPELDPPADMALDAILRLWANAFRNITKKRRKNILRARDPEFLQMLNDPQNFRVLNWIAYSAENF